MTSILDRFTDEAKVILLCAQEEARELGHTYLGTEHILVAIASDDVTGQLFADLGVGADTIRRMIRRIVGEGSDKPSGYIPFSPRVKQALIGAVHMSGFPIYEAPVTVFHVLLGVIGIRGSVAVHILQALDVSPYGIRTAALHELSRKGISIDSPKVVPVVVRQAVPITEMSREDLADLAEGLRNAINTSRRTLYRVCREQTRRQKDTQAT